MNLDWRNTGKTVNDALDEAFKRTEAPKENLKSLDGDVILMVKAIRLNGK